MTGRIGMLQFKLKLMKIYQQLKRDDETGKQLRALLKRITVADINPQRAMAIIRHVSRLTNVQFHPKEIQQILLYVNTTKLTAKELEEWKQALLSGRLSLG
jgi:hypothetical protein